MSPKRRKQRTRPHEIVRYRKDIIKKECVKISFTNMLFLLTTRLQQLNLISPVMHITVYNITFFVRHYVRQLCGVRRPPRPERWSVGLRLLLKLQSPAARKLPTSGCSGSSGGCSPSLFLESRGARRRWTGAPVLSTEVWRNFSSRKETAAEPPTEFFFWLVAME